MASLPSSPSAHVEKQTRLRRVLQPREVPIIHNGAPDLAFEWPDLEVRRSRQGHDTQDLGVFARRALPPGTVLEVLGRRVDPSRLFAGRAGRSGPIPSNYKTLNAIFVAWFAESAEAGAYYRYTHVLRRRYSTTTAGKDKPTKNNITPKGHFRHIAAAKAKIEGGAGGGAGGGVGGVGGGEGGRWKRKFDSVGADKDDDDEYSITSTATAGSDLDYDSTASVNSEAPRSNSRLRAPSSRTSSSRSNEARSGTSRLKSQGRAAEGTIVLAFPGLADTFSWNQVGGRGLWIAAMIASPKRAKPNCAFVDNYIITLDAIEEGEELLVAFSAGEESPDHQSLPVAEQNGWIHSRQMLRRVVKAGLATSPAFAGLAAGIASETFSGLAAASASSSSSSSSSFYQSESEKGALGIVQRELDAVLYVDPKSPENQQAAVHTQLPSLSESSFTLTEIRARQPLTEESFLRVKHSTIGLPPTSSDQATFIATLAAVKEQWRGLSARHAPMVGLRVAPSAYLRQRGVSANLNGLYNGARAIGAGEVVGFYDGIYSAEAPRNASDRNYSFTLVRQLAQDEGGGYLVNDPDNLPPEAGLLAMQSRFPVDVGAGEGNPRATDSWGAPSAEAEMRFRPPKQWRITSPTDIPRLGAQINTCGVGTRDCFRMQNVQFVQIFFDMFIVSLRRIEPGEELLADYKDLLNVAAESAESSGADAKMKMKKQALPTQSAAPGMGRNQGASQTRTRTLAVVLGMSWSSPSDRARLIQLQRMAPMTDLLTVSDNASVLPPDSILSPSEQASPPSSYAGLQRQQQLQNSRRRHLETTFCSRRGMQRVVAAIRQATSERRYRKVVVWLDYFCLGASPTYYRDRCSVRWLTDSFGTLSHNTSSDNDDGLEWVRNGLLHTLFTEGGVHEVVLPNDEGRQQECQSMAQMVRRFSDAPDRSLLDVQYADLASHPLWVASEQLDAEQPSVFSWAARRGYHASQTRDNLGPKRAFVVVRRSSKHSDVY